MAEATDGRDADLVIAGLLHDAIEDQGVLHRDLVDLFGKHVAELVREVTDNKSKPKDERKRLQINPNYQLDRSVQQLATEGMLHPLVGEFSA